jgi:hypothetical protein
MRAGAEATSRLRRPSVTTKYAMWLSERAVQVERGADQGEVRESLREVSQGVAAMPGVFRVEANMVGKAERRSKISLASSSRYRSWRPARVSASTSQTCRY